jgi:alkylation response protein AidB-like acyl-CoA dehydrogenase
VLLDCGDEAALLRVELQPTRVRRTVAGAAEAAPAPGRLGRAGRAARGGGSRWRPSRRRHAPRSRSAFDYEARCPGARSQFQAVQHRLALATVMVEGARWLTAEAAARGAPDESAALAAAHAADAAQLVFRETHQLSGAMGYTREHPLHVFSMRLAALRQELGGMAAQRREVARARWASA